MGRAVKTVDLSKREGRSKLAVRTEPYWSFEREGCHIGYYRGARVGKWVARHKLAGHAGGYSKTTLGEADDAPGSVVNGFMLDWKMAKAKAGKWFEEMDRRQGIRSGPYTVSDALDDYLDGFEGKDIVNTRRRIEAFIRKPLGEHDLSKLTTKMIGDWHKGIANAPARLRTAKDATQNVRLTANTDDARRRRRSSANRVLTILRAALNKAFFDKKAASDAEWRRVKPFRGVDAAKTRYLSDAESRRLVNAIDPIWRPMVQAALLTGARYAEIARLEVRDFDHQSETLWIREAKGGASRPVYLDSEGVRLFDQTTAGKASACLIFPRPADGAKWGPAQQARPMAAACKAANLDPTGFHDLRRTYGARMALQGIPMAVIAKAMGHKDERITQQHYAHLAESYVKTTVQSAASGLGIVSQKSTA